MNRIVASITTSVIIGVAIAVLCTLIIFPQSACRALQTVFMNNFVLQLTQVGNVSCSPQYGRHARIKFENVPSTGIFRGCYTHELATKGNNTKLFSNDNISKVT